MARRLEQSPDTVTSMTQPDVGPAEVVERCGMLSHLHGVCHLTPGPPMKWLMEFNELYSVNCKVLYFVLRLFPFKSFYEENGFLSLSAIFHKLG